MNKLYFLFLIFLSTIVVGCFDDDEIEFIDTKTPELKFTFEDSVYVIVNPQIDRYIDTLSYEINEPIVLYNEYISIEGIINDTQDFAAYIINAIVEPSNCIPEGTYYENYAVRKIENQCIYFTLSDEPSCEKSHCNTASIELRTVHSAMSISYANSNHGFFVIEECLNDTVSGAFESKHFKNGSFKNISITK